MGVFKLLGPDIAERRSQRAKAAAALASKLAAG